ncbi:MAG: MnhB domain-containing protein [Oscillospiraceae bacterium]|nr:MnhB domain-containing protein [bacterium]MDY5101222.1 MnhB domain-containing protein [Oscillospiraceae bacterium]
MNNGNKMKTRHVIVKCGADLYLPFAIVFGLAVILFGTVSPGGGFQGGVIVASAALLVYLGHGFDTMKSAINPHLMHKGEAVGAIAYIALASIGLVAGGNFVRNAIWNNGNPGNVISAGTITYMSWAVGFKVLTGVAFLLMLLISLLGGNQDEM